MAAKIYVQGVLFCSGGGWFSKAIRTLTRSRYSHVALVLSADAPHYGVRDFRTLTNPEVFEAMEGKGVRRMPYAAHRAAYKGSVWFSPCIPLAFDHDAATALLAAVEGESYDRIGILRFLVRRVTPSCRAEAHQNEKYFCSELVAAVWEAAGTPLPAPSATPWSSSPGFFSPADIWTAVQAQLDKEGVPVALQKL